MSHDLEDICAEFSLCAPELITHTAIAGLWRVRSADGARKVLKLYKGADAGKEAAGVELMSYVARAGGPSVLGRALTDNVFLFDDVGRFALGDLARDGQIWDADIELARCVQAFHGQSAHYSGSLPHVSDWFDALFDVTYADNCAAQLRVDMDYAKKIAHRLLNTTEGAMPLHGDFHHDNVMVQHGAHTAIDAKGVMGEPAYDLANALRNPKGCEAQITDRDLMARRIFLFAKATRTSPLRMAKWGVAKTALSITWRAKDALVQDKDATLLNALISVATAISTSHPS